MERCTDRFQSNPDFVMLAVSQDTRGRSACCAVCRRPASLHVRSTREQGRRELRCGWRAETLLSIATAASSHIHMGAFDWSRPDVKEALQNYWDSKKWQERGQSRPLLMVAIDGDLLKWLDHNYNSEYQREIQ